jgi:acyl-coenzyme A thioesterase PaaI-like protein
VATHSPLQPPGPGAILLELDLEMRFEGGRLLARAGITPEIHGPGTARLRTSVLAAWLDIVLGTGAIEAMWPRVPLTLNLDVQMLEPPPSDGAIEFLVRPLKAGRSVGVLEADVSKAGSIIGFGRGTFMAAPDPGAVMVTRPPMRAPPGTHRLSMPLAARAGIELVQTGVVLLPNRPEARNGANILTGSLIALVAEEAALSLTPGETLALLNLDFLRPVRVGPAVANARIHGGVGRVEVRDAGKDN